MGRGTKSKKKTKAYVPRKVHFQDKKLHGYILDEPGWFQPTARLNVIPYYCGEEICRRLISLPCGMCRRSSFATLSYDGFVNVYLSLLHGGLPKDIVKMIVTKYVVLTAPSVFLNCPYVRYADGIYHHHCREDIEFAKAVYDEGKAAISLHPLD